MTSEPTPASPREGRLQPRRSLTVCALIGAAVMAVVDEIVFHQVLHRHHFYDRSTPGIALLSDGLLHTGELLALVAGFFLCADLRRRHALAPAHARAGFFLGPGGSQLFDGVVDHKLLRLHRIRHGGDVTPYGWGRSLAGLAFLLVGMSLSVHAIRHAPDGTART
ncbi:DUF2243 domain-containing protein [Streptomyces viridochromogenes]|nr:DUF2243 domain-containing protein [Streptomyces viridochromogenes]